jgi:hypothetical protein
MEVQKIKKENIKLSSKTESLEQDLIVKDTSWKERYRKKCMN